MNKLTVNEMKEINGGIGKFAIAGLVVGIVTFVIGIVDGFLRPLKCR